MTPRPGDLALRNSPARATASNRARCSCAAKPAPGAADNATSVPKIQHFPTLFTLSKEAPPSRGARRFQTLLPERQAPPGRRAAPANAPSAKWKAYTLQHFWPPRVQPGESSGPPRTSPRRCRCFARKAASVRVGSRRIIGTVATSGGRGAGDEAKEPWKDPMHRGAARLKKTQTPDVALCVPQLGFICLNSLYSCRNAVIGSILIARRAGK